MCRRGSRWLCRRNRRHSPETAAAEPTQPERRPPPTTILRHSSAGQPQVTSTDVIGTGRSLIVQYADGGYPRAVRERLHRAVDDASTRQTALQAEAMSWIAIS